MPCLCIPESRVWGDRRWLKKKGDETYITEKTPQVTDTLTVWYLIENFVLNKGYASYSLETLFHTDEFAET